MPKLGEVDVETFDTGKLIKYRVWHIRRPGPEMQGTLCGVLYARRGEVVKLSKIAPEGICPQCLTKVEVA